MNAAKTLRSSTSSEPREREARRTTLPPNRPDLVEDACHTREVSLRRRGFFRALFGDEVTYDETSELAGVRPAPEASPQRDASVPRTVRPHARDAEACEEESKEQAGERRHGGTQRAPQAVKRGRPTFVSVVVPTFERPRALLRTLTSLESQTGGIRYEVIVVDNSPAASARSVVEAHVSRHPLRYVHEPTPGISAARNRGVGVARGELVAFIDDDQEAAADWLAQLVGCRASHDADAVFGWVEPVLEEGATEHGGLFAAAIARRFDSPSGRIPRRLVAKLGTGNSLFRRRVLGSAPFDSVFTTSGGEDTALIRRMVNEGACLVWCREARVREHVPASRTTLSSVLERRFSCGQVRTRQHVVGPHRSPSRSALMVVAGALQACGALPLAVLAAPFRRPFAVRMLAEAAAGAGKVLFMEPFFVQRYRRPATSSESEGSFESVDSEAAPSSPQDVALSA